MSIDVLCPCGKTMRVGDEHAGRRVKCPVCAEFVPVPAFETELLKVVTPASVVLAEESIRSDERDQPTVDRAVKSSRSRPTNVLEGLPADGESTESPPAGKRRPVAPHGRNSAQARETRRDKLPEEEPLLSEDEDSDDRHVSISGRPGRLYLGIPFPAVFGRTTLSLQGAVLHEDTRRLLTRSHGDFLLRNLQGAEIRSVMHPMLFLAAFVLLLTPGAAPVAVIFLLLFLCLRVNYLQIHASSTSLMVKVPRKGTDGERFLQRVLKESLQASD